MISNEQEFCDWLNNQLDAEIPKSIVAFNINIYESPFNIEIIGSESYDPDDEDWACNEDWVPNSRMSEVDISIYGESWEDAQKNIVKFAQTFLHSKFSNALKLKNAVAFSAGFVDGSLELIQ